MKGTTMRSRGLARSIQREDAICRLALDELKRKSRAFERRFHMSSSVFYQKFEQGALDDREAFFEWKAIIDGIHNWEQTRKDLLTLLRD